MRPVHVAVLMPAWNEAGRLARTLEDLGAATKEGGARVTVFLVDDGSDAPIEAGSLPCGVPVVLARHAVNLGQGAALETARRLALDPRFRPEGGFDAYVTMDSDGQHGAADVLRLARAIVEQGADIALGDRFAGGSNVPASRRVLLGLARVFERATTGMHLSDAHNGLRAFGPRAIERMRIRQNRMAHATELTRRISRASRRGLRVVEVPVSVRYTGESLAKGQGASGAIAILVDLFQGYLFEE
jgi:glycosyltransferase involved in cell wall biosynthesis